MSAKKKKPVKRAPVKRPVKKAKPVKRPKPKPVKKAKPVKRSKRSAAGKKAWAKLSPAKRAARVKKAARTRKKNLAILTRISEAHNRGALKAHKRKAKSVPVSILSSGMKTTSNADREKAEKAFKKFLDMFVEQADESEKKAVKEYLDTFVIDELRWRRRDGSLGKNPSRLRELPNAESLLERIDKLHDAGELDEYAHDIAEEYDVDVAEVYTFFFSS